MTASSHRASTADRIRWQRQALRIMTEAIDKGARAKLEPLMWQLGASGCAGRVSTLRLTVEQQEQTLRDWARVLRLEVRRFERGGSVRLSAAEQRAEDWMTPRIRIGVELCDWATDTGEEVDGAGTVATGR